MSKIQCEICHHEFEYSGILCMDCFKSLLFKLSMGNEDHEHILNVYMLLSSSDMHELAEKHLLCEANKLGITT